MKKVHGVRWAVLVAVLSCIPLLSLMNPGLPNTHDGKDHVARIANFYQSLSEGNVVPRWGGNLNWGYGHPVTMFLYPLPSYMASTFHWFGFSFVDSTKLVFAVAYSLSMLAMFAWATSVWGIHAGVLAALFYGFAPYRFVDMYVRGAIGEHVAFVFLPVILWGIWQLGAARFTRLAASAVAIGISSLVLSHNALSLLYLGVCALYGLYIYIWVTKDKKRFILWSVSMASWGMALSIFFWAPAFFEGKYTLRDIVTAGDFKTRFVPPALFFWSPWSYGGGNEFSKFLGLGQLIGIGMLLWGYTGLAKRDRILTSILLIVLAASLFLMTVYSSVIWAHVTILQKFQFPWRLLSVTVFLVSALGALAVVQRGIKGQIVVWILGLTTILTTYPMWHPQSYMQFPETFFTSVYNGTTDTGESSPIWSVRFMEKRATAPMEVISGTGMIEMQNRISTSHKYKIFADTGLQLVEHTLYFPGWNVYVDGIKVPVEFQNPDHRGLMTFSVGRGIHEINVRFEQTKLRRVSDAISLAAAVSFIVFLGTMAVWRPKKQHSR